MPFPSVIEVEFSIFSTAGARRFVNVRPAPEFWQVDYSWEGFQWIVPDDHKQSIVAFLRKDAKGNQIMVVCNFNPVLREKYDMGVPVAGYYKELLNSDDKAYVVPAKCFTLTLVTIILA